MSKPTDENKGERETPAGPSHSPGLPAPAERVRRRPRPDVEVVHARPTTSTPIDEPPPRPARPLGAATFGAPPAPASNAAGPTEFSAADSAPASSGSQQSSQSPSSPPPTSRRRIFEPPPPSSHAPRSSTPKSNTKPSSRRGTPLPVSARNVAAEVVARVERDGAYAAAVLDHELRRAVQLDGRDRALATELVYGTLRLRPLLERSLEAATPRGIQSLDPRTRALLLVAAYQLHYTRIPAFAAVSEAVEAVRTVKGRVLGGFANGALRAVAQQAQGKPLPRPPIAFREATAPWLRRALERSIGHDTTEALLAAGPYPPPVHLRVRDRGEGVEAARVGVIEQLRAAVPNAAVAPTQWAPGAIAVAGGGDPHALPGHAEGLWTIQEEGSQLIGHLLGARGGDVVLDACAGRGNKSSLLGEAVGQKGRVDVADVHPDKLLRLAQELARLGLPEPKTFGVDWSLGTGEVPEAAYDRVLVDAPCSGTGTIRRRPEIQTRRQAVEIEKLSELQTTIVTNAARALKPGGRLVFSVCSVLRDEAERVVASVLAARPELEPVAFDAPIAERLFGRDASAGRLLTHLHGTDSYFAASFRRRDSSA